MLQKSTITLLRIPFSFFLMPVFFFALSQVPHINFLKASLVFVILHFILYPASNGYNSYMDRDEGSIGMIEKPPEATRQLFVLTAVLDCMAIMLAFLVNYLFVVCIVANILASRAYSYRGIRLKRFPVVGFLTVVVFQGAITFLMVYAGAYAGELHQPPWAGMLISSLLFGGFYPLTQVYQHKQDLDDGVITISYKLGTNGTFIFSGIMYAMAEVVLFMYLSGNDQQLQFWILQVFFLPVVIYFLYWWKKVLADRRNANYQYSLRMNIVAASCTNTAFTLIFLLNHRAFE